MGVCVCVWGGGSGGHIVSWYNLETVQIPNICVPYDKTHPVTSTGVHLRNCSDPHPKTILVFLMIRHIQWHRLGIPTGAFLLTPTHPTSLKVSYLRNHSYSHPLTIYTCVPYDKTHPMTLTGDPPGGMPHLFHFINGLKYLGNHSDPHPYTIYIHVPYDKTNPGTLTDHCTQPFIYHLTNILIHETFWNFADINFAVCFLVLIII